MPEPNLPKPPPPPPPPRPPLPPRARPVIRDYVAYADCGTAEERARHNASIGHNPRSNYVYADESEVS